jgi:deferrochelatase/peroxidase EfeB
VDRPRRPAAPPPQGALTRRRLLALAGGGALGLALDPGQVAGAAQAPAGQVVAFHGRHQAGILTPPQSRLVFAAFDLEVARADELADLLRVWTAASARMAAGHLAAPAGDDRTPPADPGEAVGLPPARLTITVGLGPGVFARGRRGGLGLAGRRPAALAPLPPLSGDRLDPARSGGDLCVQACADDPQVAFHAVHALANLGRGAVALRLLQAGFTGSAGPRTTPRNLQGFKDGTRNIAADDARGLRRHVWAGAEEPQRWFRGGTYLVCRRIRMRCERWDRSSLAHQEAVIGRHKDNGAPLGGRDEHDVPDLAARGPDGVPVIPMSAHVRVSAPESNGGIRILRRGYSFTDGADPATGEIDAGLFFICFARDPHRQFVALQRRLANSDALNDYIEHTSSAVFAIPPGAAPGGCIAEGLFRA